MEEVLDAAALMEIIPHRPPFLLVDRITELIPGERAVGERYVDPQEPILAGHFPGAPVLPGVLVVEALAQVGAVAILALDANRGKIPLFAGIDGCRFRRPVKPGERLTLSVEIERSRGRIGKGRATATVDGEIAAETALTFVVADKGNL